MPTPLALLDDHVNRLRTEHLDPIERLDSAHLIHRAADELLRDTVAQARAAGVTWSSIADHLEVTRQAASQRYRDTQAPEPPPKLTRQQRRAQERARRGS